MDHHSVPSMHGGSATLKLLLENNTKIMLLLDSLKLTGKMQCVLLLMTVSQSVNMSANCICVSVDDVQVIMCFSKGTDRPPERDHLFL